MSRLWFSRFSKQPSLDGRNQVSDHFLEHNIKHFPLGRDKHTSSVFIHSLNEEKRKLWRKNSNNCFFSISLMDIDLSLTLENYVCATSYIGTSKLRQSKTFQAVGKMLKSVYWIFRAMKIFSRFFFVFIFGEKAEKWWWVFWLHLKHSAIKLWLPREKSLKMSRRACGRKKVFKFYSYHTEVRLTTEKCSVYISEKSGWNRRRKYKKNYDKKLSHL